MAMRPAVSYIPCATSSREQTGNIITFAQFKEGGLLYETFDDAKISDESGDDSIMPPLISEEEMGDMDSCDDSDAQPMSEYMLEDIPDSSNSHPSVNRIEAR